MKHDIFIDNNIASRFSRPADPEYKKLIEWLMNNRIIEEGDDDDRCDVCWIRCDGCSVDVLDQFQVAEQHVSQDLCRIQVGIDRAVDSGTGQCEYDHN